jgi:hypothetical protein
MTSPDQNQPDVDPRDLRICRYLDGSMPADERAEFERDMLRDPSLHRETEAFDRSDRQVAEALDALLEPNTRSVRHRSRDRNAGAGIRRIVAVAATLILAVTTYVVIYGPARMPDGGDELARGNTSAGESAEAFPPSETPDEYTGGSPAGDAASGPHGDVDTDSAVASIAGKDEAGLFRYGSETLTYYDGSAPPQPVTLASDAVVTCGDTPAPPHERDLPGRLKREGLRCSTSGANVMREFIGVVDEESGDVYMIQLDHVESDASTQAEDL